MEEEELGHELASIRDAGAAGRGLAYYATMLALPFAFKKEEYHRQTDIRELAKKFEKQNIWGFSTDVTPLQTCKKS